MPDLDLESRLHDELHDRLGEGPTPSGRWPQLEAAAHEAAARRRRGRRSVVLACSAALVAVLVGVVVAHGSTHDRVDTGPIHAGSPTTAAVPTTTASPALPGRLVARVSVPGAVGPLLATADGVWVLTSAGVLEHIDLQGRVVAQLALPWQSTSCCRSGPPGSSYGGPAYFASGQGSVWVLIWASATLLRVDPATAKVTGRLVFSKGADGGAEVERVAVGAGHVWVTRCCSVATQSPTGNQQVERIDPSTMRIDGHVAVPGDGESESVVAGPQGVFVTGEDFAGVAQVDPGAMRVIREIAVPGGTGEGMVAIGSSVWVLGGWDHGNSSGSALYTIDPATGAVDEVMALPQAVQQLAPNDTGLFGAEPPPLVLPAPASWPIVDLSGREERVTRARTTGGVAAFGDRVWYLDGTKLIEWQT